MQPTLCSRCGKNVAVIFITRMDGDKPVNEGLCLKCARELHIKPVDDVLNKMGLSDEELEGLTNEMMEALSNADGLMDIENTDSDSDDEGKTATFPFLNRLFGNMGGQKPENSAPGGELTPAQSGPEQGGQSQQDLFERSGACDQHQKRRARADSQRIGGDEMAGCRDGNVEIGRHIGQHAHHDEFGDAQRECSGSQCDKTFFHTVSFFNTNGF